MLQAHDHLLARGRETRREGHAGEVADDLALSAVDVEQKHARVGLPVGHVGEFLRGRREARRQHEILATRQIFHVRAVLIHDGEPLDAPLLRPGLVDERDARVEIALLAGEPLVDRVRNDVSDAAPVVRRREILLAGELIAGEHIPQPEFDLEPPIGLARHAARDERLRVDCAPVRKARHGVDIGYLFDVSGRIDRRE